MNRHLLLFLILAFSAAAQAPQLKAKGDLDLDALPKAVDGFSLNFVVKEPHIINPSALCFDRQGRLYVGAGPQYRGPQEDSPTDYIKLIIDKDDDGVADEVKTFAEGFNSVQGLAWKGDELWVANAPELTVLRDTDGDDVADEYQVIYTGLGNLRHGLHGLNWGPDGWLYMSTGNTWVMDNAPLPFRELMGVRSDDKTEYPLTKVYSKESYPKSYHSMRKRELEGGILRCRPGGHELEIWARGMRNPWDICFDSGFNWLGTDNDPGPPGERIFNPIPFAHYTMRHAWVFDWMGEHPAVAPASDIFPGVSGSGCGVTFYNADHFPAEYRNRYLIADWTNNCIFLYAPKWDGALQVPAIEKTKIVDGGTTRAGDLGYVGGKGVSLFRPTDIAIGPSGALYIAGWGADYGTAYVPKDKWNAEENAKYQGRVFRLRHESPLIPRSSWSPAKRSKPIAQWTFAELLADMGHHIPIWRVDAQDEMIRRGAAIRAALIKAIDSNDLSEAQATWCMWTLARVDGEEAGTLIAYAKDAKDLNRRIQATRAIGEVGAKSANSALIGLLSDPEPRIRLAAIQSLGRTGFGEQSVAILDALAGEKDRCTRYTAWQVLRRQLSVETRRELLKDERPGIRYLALLSLLETKGEADPSDVIRLRGDSDPEVRDMASQWLRKTGYDSIELSLSVDEKNFRDKTQVRATLKAKGKFQMRYTTDGSDPTADSPEYKKAIVLEQDATVKVAVFADKQLILQPETISVHKITEAEWKDRLFVTELRNSGKASYEVIDDGLQRGVRPYVGSSDTIVTLPEALAGATIIRTHPADHGSADNKELISFRTNLAGTLTIAVDSRYAVPAWIDDNYSKLDEGLTTSREGGHFHLYQRHLPAGEISLGGNRSGKGGKTHNMYQVYLSLVFAGGATQAASEAAMAKADLAHGEALFFGRGTCFACHQVQGKGIVIGPDLVNIAKRRDAAYVIQSIIDPDAYIVEGFQQTSLELRDGSQLFGMIQEETAEQIQLFLLTGEEVAVKASDVRKRDDAKHSGMPGSFAYTLSAQDVADLSAWIMTLK
jgi:putative membrane-bound dehydrogenase-like protein